ncbi:IS3 family transposase [Mycobacterium tuberculosis]
MAARKQCTIGSPTAGHARAHPTGRKTQSYSQVRLRTAHRDNYSVYGINKMHQAMKRKGWHLGREQTRPLMRKAGLCGVQRPCSPPSPT